MNAAGHRCGVVIAAHDEEASIGRCLAALQDGLPSGFARVVVSCNGCRDRTAEIARSCAIDGWTVLERPQPGKALAIRQAETLLPAVPRVFLDADIEFRGADLVRLVETLEHGPWHLVSPLIRHREDGCGPLARSLNRTWRELPHARTHAFHHVLGVSVEGRRRWGEFPEVLGDDAFIAARFAPEERRIIQDATVWTRPPRSLAAWVRVRERWLRGERELRALGLADPHPSGQRSEIRRRALDPRRAPGAWLYATVRAWAALRIACLPGPRAWYRDDTSRRTEGCSA